MQFCFRFDFVLREVELSGFHNDRCKLQAFDRSKEPLFQVPEFRIPAVKILSKGLQELLVFDSIGVILGKGAAGTCHELVGKAPRFEILGLTLLEHGILVQDGKRLRMG